MKFRIIVKIGVALSVLLFCVAVGLYSFASLQEAGKGKDVDLFSMIPGDSYGILDTDNIDYYTAEFARMSYSRKDTSFHYSDIMYNILTDLNKFTSLSPHGISNKVKRIVMSIHDSEFSKGDIIAYFKVDKGGKQYLFDLINKRYNNDVISKSENYRGKKIEIYSLGKTSKFLSVFSGDGFIVISYHKRLIEKVIDSVMDESSVRFDKVFSRIQSKKSVNYMTFYSRESSFPAVSVDCADIWSEFELHMNSDVLYLSGSMYQPDDCTNEIRNKLNNIGIISKDSLLVVSGQERVDSCISRVMLAPHNSIFDECVSNLSKDASYIMVVDMDKVEEDPDKYKSFLPDFIFSNIGFFRSFIISLQITEVNGRFSHIYVFTYKY